MVRKRKAKEKEVDPPVWCFYCDRIFGDETSLLIHQKEKHWRCTDCKRKMHSAAALQVHSSQVHKINLSAVPFAKPGRGSFDIEVFGMAGIPEGMKRGVDSTDAGEHSAKQQRVEVPPSLPPPPSGLPPGRHSAAPQPAYSVGPPPMMQPMMQPPVYPGMPPPMGFPGHPPPWGFPPGLGPPPGMAPPHMLAQSLPPHSFAPPPGAPANGAAPQLFPISLPASAEGSKRKESAPTEAAKTE